MLFDLDGTLTDPKVGITRSIQHALRKRGVDPPDADALAPLIGPPLLHSFQEAFGFSPDEARRAVEDYREYFSDRGLYENEVYPGIPELLARLRAEGRRIALATSKPTVYAERILAHFDLARHFEVVIGSFLDGRRVEKREVVAAALSGLASRRAVMVGDRKHDVEGARANGIAAIAVTWGYGPPDELLVAAPQHLARSVDELGRILA